MGSKKHAMHFAEVKRRNHGRISKQNYCTYCSSREKHKETGTVCAQLGYKPIEQAMKTCALLEPFDRYVENKANRGGVSDNNV